MRTAVTSYPVPATRCPGCCSSASPGSPASPAEPYCQSCGIWLAGPQVAEVRWIDGELGRVDAARTALISRRAALIDELLRLRRQAAAGEPSPDAASRPAAGPASAGPAVAGPAATGGDPLASAAARPARRPEVSARTAARLLLAAGVMLVVIAAIVFTVADWARVGPLGRGAILLGVTGLVLAAPRPLVRRNLHATAESVAAIGLALTLADTYLARRLVPGGLATGPLAAAAASAALAGAWAGYGGAARLRGPRLAAIALAQLTGPLVIAGLAIVLRPGSPLIGPVALGLVLTAGADAALADRAERHGHQAETTVATIAATSAWLIGVLLAAAALVGSGTLWLTAVVFTAAAAIGIAGPVRSRPVSVLAGPSALVSGALLAVGLSIPVTAVLPGRWGLLAVAAASVTVTAVALAAGRRVTALAGTRGSAGRPDAEAPATIRADLAAAGSAAMLAGTGLISVPAALAGLIPPNRPLAGWSGYAARAHSGVGLPAWSGPQAATAVLALAGLACWLAPASLPRRSRMPVRSAGLIAAILAAGSVPAAAHLTGWAALAALTAAAVGLLGAGVVLADRSLAGIASVGGTVLAATAAAWSLTGPAPTIAELAVLSVVCCLTAGLARTTLSAVLGTAGALAAAAGLACAGPLASGWPARYAAFAALAVAVAAIGAATALRAARPRHSVVLDLGAGVIALLCAVMTAASADTLAALAATAALIASSTAWQRAGRRREIALAAAACAALVAVGSQWRPLATALLAPGRMIAHPWLHSGATATPGLPLAVAVLAGCLAAVVTGTGAWRGSGRASLDAVAVALPVVAAPAGVLAGGLSYWLTVAALLVLTLALTAWAARGPSLAPAGGALIGAALTVAWALAAPLPTLIVLGCLTVAYPACAWRSRRADIRVAAGCLSVLAAAALAECLVLAAGDRAWQGGLAVLAVAGTAQLAAALAVRAGGWGPTSLAIEITAWLVTAAGVGQCLLTLETAALALAAAALICLGVSVRAVRRRAVWAGLALGETAWCCWLMAAGAGVPEAYTLPAAVMVLLRGWRESVRDPQASSWLAYGPGLALLLLPSLAVVWQSPGWLRPVLLGLTATWLAVAGARWGKQAPLLAGIVVAVLAAGRELVPAVLELVHGLPGWIPIAVLGTIMLWAGATYEARLRNLSAIRRHLAAMS